MFDFFAADFEDLGEDQQQHPEEHQRTDQRPEVAEHGAEVDALEFGHRDQLQQVEEAAPAAAERGRALDLAQLGDRATGGGVGRRCSSLDVLDLDLDRGGRATITPRVSWLPKTTKVSRFVDVEGDPARAVDAAVDEVAARREPVFDGRR